MCWVEKSFQWSLDEWNLGRPDRQKSISYRQFICVDLLELQSFSFRKCSHGVKYCEFLRDTLIPADYPISYTLQSFNETIKKTSYCIKNPARPWKPSIKSDSKSHIMTVSQSIIILHSLWMTNAKGMRSFHGEMLLVSVHNILNTIDIQTLGYCLLCLCYLGLGPTPLSLAHHNSQISFPAALDETRNQAVIVIF